jgi:hypothetical protein
VPLNFLNNVSGLYFTFEAPESVFQGLALLDNDFRHALFTPRSLLVGIELSEMAVHTGTHFDRQLTASSIGALAESQAKLAPASSEKVVETALYSLPPAECCS